MLPEAYRRYLELVGSGAGGFLMGSNFLFRELDRVQSGADALLADDGIDGLPPNAFVFCSHQGYQFLYFHVTGDPDPKVKYYLEGERVHREVAGHFSEWLETTVSEECRHAADVEEV